MSLKRLRPLIAVTCSALTLALPVQSEACWLFDCFHRAPACPAPACPTPVATQVNYVPQTCYRTVYSPVAVTSYRPVCTTDPCTGCPVQSMTPVTTYVQRPVVVPYTTYRPVVTTVQMPVVPACSTCSACAAPVAPTATYYAPAAVAAPAPSCGCGASTGVATSAYYAPLASNYGGATTSYYAGTPATGYYGASPATNSSPTTTYYPPTYPQAPSAVGTSTVISGSSNASAPITTYYNGAPAGVTPGPVILNSSSPSSGASAPAIPNTGVPSLPNNGGGTQPQKPGDMNTQPDNNKQTPIPDMKDPAKSGSTGILKYEPSGRTTAMPTMRPWSYTTVSQLRVATVSTTDSKPIAEETDADGWHAAR